MADAESTPSGRGKDRPSRSEWIEVGARMERVIRAVGKSRVRPEDVEDLRQDSLIKYFQQYVKNNGNVGIGLQVRIATLTTLDWLNWLRRRRRHEEE